MKKTAKNEKRDGGGKGAKRIVLCGYYGRGNFGDEAILAVLKSRMCEICLNEKAEKSRTSSSATVGDETLKITKNMPKICVLNSKDPIKILKMLRGADVFVFGGGSLLQNTTSSASLLYYIAVIRLARLLAHRTVMLANGFGPIN